MMYRGIPGDSPGHQLDIASLYFQNDALESCKAECDKNPTCVGFVHLQRSSIHGKNCWTKRDMMTYPPYPSSYTELYVYYKLRK